MKISVKIGLDIRNEAYGILQREDTLKEIVKLLGPDALPDEEKLILRNCKNGKDWFTYNKTHLTMLIHTVVQRNNSNY